MQGISIVEILTFIVAVLGLLTTVLIAWQIYQIAYVEKLVKRRVAKKLEEYDGIITKRLASQQVELLTSMITILVSSEDYNTAILISSHLPSQLERANVMTDSNFKKEIEKIEVIFQSASEDGYLFLEERIQNLIDSFLPYMNFPSVREFVFFLQQQNKT